MQYEWDDSKNRYNQKVHKISFEQAANFLDFGIYDLKFDEDHSKWGEDRFIAIGPFGSHAMLSVVFIELVEGQCVRIISARKV